MNESIWELSLLIEGKYMRTFLAELFIQAVFESHSIHHAANNNTLTIVALFNESSQSTFKKNWVTIRVLLMKKTHCGKQKVTRIITSEKICKWTKNCGIVLFSLLWKCHVLKNG